VKLPKFALFDKRKMAFLHQNHLEPIYHNKHSISDRKKQVKAGICCKSFEEVYTF